jgi:hypothetical protein
MKKLTLLLLISFAFLQNTHACAWNYGSPVPSGYHCNNGSLFISVNDVLLGELDLQMQVRHSDGNYVDTGAAVVLTSFGFHTFDKLPPGQYKLEAHQYFLGGQICGDDHYFAIGENSCTVPTVARVESASSSFCNDGVVVMSDSTRLFNYPAGVQQVSGSIVCDCGIIYYSYSVNITTYPVNDIILHASSGSTCNSNLGGRIDVEVAGVDVHHYVVDINATDGSYSNSTTFLPGQQIYFTGLPPATYTVTVHEYRYYYDGTNYAVSSCPTSKSATATISTTGQTFFTPAITATSAVNTGCGFGRIDITVPNDSSGFYSTLWSLPWQAHYIAYLYDTAWNSIASSQGFTNITFNNLPVGHYNTVVVGQRFDAPLCPAPFVTADLKINTPVCNLSLQATTTAPSHLNCTDGSITASMQNYSDSCSPHIDLYNAADSLVGHWSPASGSLPYMFKNLTAGSYHIVAGSGSCSSDTIVTINDGPCDIQFNMSAVQGLHGCKANQLKVAYTGNICGLLNFTYQNNDTPFNAGTFTSGDSINFATTNDLPPGNYTITGSSGSCTASHSFLVSDAPCTLNATVTATNNGTCSASISGTVTNFCTSLTIELRRSSDDSLYSSTNTSGSNYLFSMLGNGSYKIVITDAGGCTVTKTTTISGLTCTAPTGGSYAAINPRKGTVSWNLSNCATAAVGYTVQYRVQGTTGWSSKQVITNTNSVVLTNLQTNTVYECRIRTKCVSNALSVFGPIFTFNTNGSLSATSGPEALKSASVSDEEIKAIPNPTNGRVTIVFNSDKAGKYSIDITSANGNLLQHKEAIAIKGENEIQFDLSNFTAGLYMIVLRNDEQQSRSAKLIKL